MWGWRGEGGWQVDTRDGSFGLDSDGSTFAGCGAHADMSIKALKWTHTHTDSAPTVGGPIFLHTHTKRESE